MRDVGARWVRVGAVLLCGLAGAGLATGSARGQDADPAAAQALLMRAQEPDTVRTNLWIIEVLMTDVLETTLQSLPSRPASLELRAEGDTDADVLFDGVATRNLTRAGYQLYESTTGEPVVADAAASADSAGADSTTIARPADAGRFAESTSGEGPRYRLIYRVVELDLAYPETSRRFGIWRQWVARDVDLTVSTKLLEISSGRVLFSDHIQRRFDDRVPNAAFKSVESDVYPFTAADPGESGWRSRLEEIVVLGTLAGLVAVYFANTQ